MWRVWYPRFPCRVPLADLIAQLRGASAQIRPVRRISQQWGCEPVLETVGESSRVTAGGLDAHLRIALEHGESFAEGCRCVFVGLSDELVRLFLGGGVV